MSKIVFTFRAALFSLVLITVFHSTPKALGHVKKVNFILRKVFRFKMASQAVGENLAYFEFNSFIRGYHAYSKVWTPIIGDVLLC